MAAKEHYFYVFHALKNSTITSNPRIVELIEQVDFMMEQMSKMMTRNITGRLNEDGSEITEEREKPEEPEEQATQDPPASNAESAN
ncbi:MAG: hypothetical protein KZQ56_09335 [gamma proteobacterium symbiont of Lucinoma myriamae]|nr:hypothetical protein [gamma proteobacterium symbiont of Lucinoma myriamae]